MYMPLDHNDFLGLQVGQWKSMFHTFLGIQRNSLLAWHDDGDGFDNVVDSTTGGYHHVLRLEVKLPLEANRVLPIQLLSPSDVLFSHPFSKQAAKLVGFRGRNYIYIEFM